MKEPRTYIVKIEPGEPLDAICFKHYGSLDYWSAVLAANPKIANSGDIVPCGTRILLPEVTKKRETERVKLWE